MKTVIKAGEDLRFQRAKEKLKGKARNTKLKLTDLALLTGYRPQRIHQLAAEEPGIPGLRKSESRREGGYQTRFVYPSEQLRRWIREHTKGTKRPAKIHIPHRQPNDESQLGETLDSAMLGFVRWHNRTFTKELPQANRVTLEGWRDALRPAHEDYLSIQGAIEKLTQ
jgi:hypothetical protein